MNVYNTPEDVAYRARAASWSSSSGPNVSRPRNKIDLEEFVGQLNVSRQPSIPEDLIKAAISRVRALETCLGSREITTAAVFVDEEDSEIEIHLLRVLPNGRSRKLAYILRHGGEERIRITGSSVSRASLKWSFDVPQDIHWLFRSD